MSRVFVVTGSNKGIGKSIVRLLLQDKEEKIVYLTSRNKEAGEQVVKDFENEGLKPKYHQLDITDRKSIESLRDHLLENYGGFDVLVNNAGIAYKGNSTAPFGEQAEVSVACNFYGTLDACEILFPILKKNGRNVNVSSYVSEMAYNYLSEDMKKKFANPSLTMQGLKDLMESFVQSAKDGSVKSKGFAETAYGMSKVAVSFMTQIHQKELDKSAGEKNILVNSCCPGDVITDMSSQSGDQTPDQGADTPAYLALLPVTATSPRGSFHKLRKVIPYPPQN